MRKWSQRVLTTLLRKLGEKKKLKTTENSRGSFNFSLFLFLLLLLTLVFKKYFFWMKEIASGLQAAGGRGIYISKRKWLMEQDFREDLTRRWRKWLYPYFNSSWKSPYSHLYFRKTWLKIHPVFSFPWISMSSFYQLLQLRMHPGWSGEKGNWGRVWWEGSEIRLHLGTDSHI